MDTGHGADGAADFAAGSGEEGEDELVRVEGVFADEAAEGWGMAEAAWACGGELGEGGCKIHGGGG